MVDDLTDRLARYRADLDAAVLADLATRHAGPTEFDHASRHSMFVPQSSDGSMSVPGNGDAMLEVETAQLPPERSRRGIAARTLVIAATVAAIAATCALLISRDDTTAPGGIPN